MKYVWEECDIIMGRQFDTTNRGGARSMIGYCDNPKVFIGYCLFTMINGCIYCQKKTKEELVEYLNGVGARPIEIQLPDIQKD